MNGAHISGAVQRRTRSPQGLHARASHRVFRTSGMPMTFWMTIFVAYARHVTGQDHVASSSPLSSTISRPEIQVRSPGERALSGEAGFGRSAKAKKEDDVSQLMDLTPDPRDPHPVDFEPRRGLHEDGVDIWSFGKIHGTVHHVLTHALAGDPSSVANELDTFSSEHKLDFGLGLERGLALGAAVRAAVNASGLTAPEDIAGPAPRRGVHVLVLGARLCSSTIRCLPPLISARGAGNAPHEVVSVEDDPEQSHGCNQLVDHAIGTAENVVRHTALMPGDDTMLDETLETLRDNYEFDEFDIVVLPVDETRDAQIKHVVELLRSRALRQPGGVVVAFGRGKSDAATRRYIDSLSSFEVEVLGLGDDGAAVVSTYRGGHGTSNEL